MPTPPPDDPQADQSTQPDPTEDPLRAAAREAWNRVPNMRGDQSGKPLTTGELTTLGGIGAMGAKAAAGAAQAAAPLVQRGVSAIRGALSGGGGPPTGAGPWEPPAGGAGGLGGGAMVPLMVIPDWAKHYIETGETTSGGDPTL